MLAGRLGSPITHISKEKAAELDEIKKKMGLPYLRPSSTKNRQRRI
jgi:hypothetical protein